MSDANKSVPDLLGDLVSQSSTLVQKEVQLARAGLMREGGEPSYTFVTTGSPDEFETIGRRFLGPEMVAASQLVGGLA